MKRLIAIALSAAALAAGAWDAPIFRVSGVINGVMGSIVESGTHPGYAANADTAQVVRVYSPAADNPYGLAADVQKTREWIYNTFVFGGSRYLTATASPGEPFPTHAAMTNALATHSTVTPTIFYNGVPADPQSDDWCVVLSDETHTNDVTGVPATTRWGFVGKFGAGGQFQFQIKLSDSSFTPEQLAALDSTVTKELVDWGWHMRTNGVGTITNDLWSAIAKGASSTNKVATSMLTNANGSALVDLKDIDIVEPGGMKWTQTTYKTLTYCMSSIVYLDGKYFGGSRNGLGVLCSEDGGITWDAVRPDGNWYICYGNGIFVGANWTTSDRFGLWYSDDGGSTWEYSNLHDHQFNGIAYGDGHFVAVGYGVGIWCSDDGKNWHVSSVTDETWWKVAWNGGVFAATGPSGLWYSEDNGETWAQSDMSEGSWEFVAAGGGRFIAGGNELGIWWSDDGRHWTQSDKTDGWFGCAAYGAGRWVAGDINRTGLWYSDDNGETWRETERKTSGWYGIGYGGGKYVATGTSGIFYSDADKVEHIVPLVQKVSVNGTVVKADSNNVVNVEIPVPGDYAAVSNAAMKASNDVARIVADGVQYAVKSNALGEAEVASIRFTDVPQVYFGPNKMSGAVRLLWLDRFNVGASMVDCWYGFGAEPGGKSQHSISLGPSCDAGSCSTSLGFGSTSRLKNRCVTIGHLAVANHDDSLVVSASDIPGSPYGSHGNNTINFGFTDNPASIYFKDKTLGSMIGDAITSATFDASKITSGTFADARIPNLAASKITSGTFADARIPSLAASKVTSGTFSADRIPSLDASKVTSGTFADARIASAATWNNKADKASVTAATRCKITYNAQGIVTAGANLAASDIPSLAASKITSGKFTDAFIESASWDCDGVQLWSGGPYWATCNVGATSPGDAGLFFYWGGSVGYQRQAGKWLTKYTEGADSEVVFHPDDTTAAFLFNKTTAELYSGGYITASSTSGVLNPAYDAAAASMSGSWRMPTSSETAALLSNCTWTWGTYGGVRGYLVTGKGNYSARSIFLPAAGYGTYGSSITQPQHRKWGLAGNYWLANPADNSTHAYFFSFDETTHKNNTRARWYGHNVRAVRTP